MQGDRETLHVSSPEADQIISAHDGDVALLWLYRLRRPEGDLEDAARALCRTLKEMEAAFEKLRRMGLARGEEKPVQPEKQQKLPPADERPEYTAKDLAVRSREDPRFAGLVTEAQRKLGRTLSSSDLKTLFGIYDNLALPTEVIMMLLNYCVSLRPKGNPPSMRQIEKEGYVWANREILTIEQAEEYIAGSERRSDKTLTNTGGLKWGYMNGILKSWHEKGLHTPQDVREKDARRTRGKAGGVKAPKDIETLIAGLDKI